MRIWVDTDFGFDDLWALLLLKHLNINPDGISLVAGNTPLPQVLKNAEAAIHSFDFNWPVYVGAKNPLQRKPETAERILGVFGMQSRGLFLPYSVISNIDKKQSVSAIKALAQWLSNSESHQLIALGPLTNLAQLILQHPQEAKNIKQISWLGGSRGRGNHSEYAEYNALADPEALAIVANSGIPLRMIDLELCRQVTFKESDIPIMVGANRQLVSDLLGGYLDIAVQRGRASMSIYDPLAVLSVVQHDLFNFESASLVVNTQQGEEYGRTVISDNADRNTGNLEIALEINVANARRLCLSALVDA